MRPAQSPTWIALIILAIGCSGDRSPVAQPVDGVDLGTTWAANHNQNDTGIFDSHVLWGTYDILIDMDKGIRQVTPIRLAASHWNVLKWLEQEPCADCVKIVGASSGPGSSVNVDIAIKHPFSSLNLTGFDVRGIAMFNGSHLFPVSGLNASDHSIGDSELLNADGYTTLYNPTTTDHGPFESYLKGKLGTAGAPNALLNGYKRYISDFSGNSRNIFSAGDEVMTTFQIEVSTPLEFSYAVDACWAPPISKPVDDPVTDFGPEANCPEPWKIEVEESGPGLTPEGGSIALSIVVYDWQGKDSHDAPLLECPELFDGQIPGSLQEEGAGYSTWVATVENTKLAKVGRYRCLISVEDHENDPVNKPWLDLKAYAVHPIEVRPAFDLTDVTPPWLQILPEDVWETPK